MTALAANAFALICAMICAVFDSSERATGVGGKGALEIVGAGVVGRIDDTTSIGVAGVVRTVVDVWPPEERSPALTSASEDWMGEERRLEWLEVRLRGSPFEEHCASPSGQGVSTSEPVSDSMSISQSPWTGERLGDAASCLHLLTLSLTSSGSFVITLGAANSCSSDWLLGIVSIPWSSRPRSRSAKRSLLWGCLLGDLHGEDDAMFITEDDFKATEGREKSW